ncbi:MAG: VWA domain-containing protein [Pseudomonadota bacterium]
MSLLAPLFLLSGLLIGLPLWLHRLQTKSSDTVAFSSTMLMEASREQVHVRKTIRYKLLLLLRILFLLLLAFAFAKPFSTIVPEAVPSGSGSHLIVLDTSASMLRESLLESAKERVRGIVQDLPAGSAAQLYQANGELREISLLTAHQNELLSGLSQIQATNLRLDYGTMMSRVSALLPSLPKPVVLHFVSDFQSSGLPGRFSDLIVPGVSSFLPYSVYSEQDNTWSLEYARPTSAGIVVGVTGPKDSESFGLRWSLNGEEQESLYFATTGSVSLPPIAVDSLLPGDNQLSIELLTDDAWPLDNNHHVVVENPEPVTVPILVKGNGANHVFVESALGADSKIQYIPERLSIASLDTRTLVRYPWVMVDNVLDLEPTTEQGLKDYLEQGGSVLAFVPTELPGELTELPLTGQDITPAQLSEPGLRNVGGINSSHPVLSKTRGWFDVTVSDLPPVMLQASQDVLVSLDDGSPFVVEQKLGAGRLVSVLGSLTNGNDFATKPVFAAFIVELARYLSGDNRVSKSLIAGEVVYLTREYADQAQVTDPSGRRLLSLADTTRSGAVGLDHLGFYRVHTTADDYDVAVNVDLREADSDIMSPELLENWASGFSDVQGGSSNQLIDLKGDEQVKEWWHIVLMALLLVVLAEAFLANVYLGVRGS